MRFPLAGGVADAGYVIRPPGLGLLADLTSPTVALGAIFAVTAAEKRGLA